MINWNIDFTKNSVYFKADDLVTSETASIMEALGVTHNPTAALIPIDRRYQEQDVFNNDKLFLIRRLLHCGFPYSGTILRPNGHRMISSPAKNVWAGVIYGRSSQGERDKYKPSGDCQAIRIELGRIGKTARIPSLNSIILKDTSEPFIDNTIVISDMWEQRLPQLDTPITFLTAYAHINGFPERWYTQFHFFVWDGKFHIFPEYISSSQTFDMCEKNLAKNVCIQVEDHNVLKIVANSILLNDPVWTTTEDIFEYQAPIWFNRFMKHIPEAISKFDVDICKSPYPPAFMVSEPAVTGMSRVLTSSWIRYPDNNCGFFNGVALLNNKLIYGMFTTARNNDRYVSSPSWIMREDSLEPTPDASLIFRPGFKQYLDKGKDNAPQEAKPAEVVQPAQQPKPNHAVYAAPAPLQERFGTSLGDMLNVGQITPVTE